MTVLRDDDIMPVPGLPALAAYLQGAGWTLEDEDARTSMWRPLSMTEDDLRIVLPSRQEVRDYAERVDEALRTLAYAERRLPQEIAEDISFGGADSVAVRLTPEAPPGQVPLLLAHSVVSALRSFVVASAAALDVHSLVLPPRRPIRAESYASKVRLSTRPGSFVLTLALPLLDTYADDEAEEASGNQDPMFQIPPQPFGRQVTNRMLAATQHAQRLADDVSAGREQLRAFGQPGHAAGAANATELAALQALGGPDYDLYQLRFAQSPLAPERREPVNLQITPGQQRILGEAADFLRTKQPRTGVTAQGLVVRLYRQSKLGPGEVVIEGFDDDSGTTRRYRVQLGEDDYNDAVRAHRNGLQVAATGDLEIRGTHLWLRRLVSFSVIPGLEYDDEPADTDFTF